MKKLLFLFIPLIAIVSMLLGLYLAAPEFIDFHEVDGNSILKDTSQKTAEINTTSSKIINTTPTPFATPTPRPQHNSITTHSLVFSFMGDILLDGYVGNLIEQKAPEYILSDIKQLLSLSDVAAANLENPLSDRGTKEVDKEYTFRARPQSLKVLSDGGINLVALANNHILDFGPDALLDTFTHLKSNNILYAGAGENVDNANAPVYLEKKGVRIAFLASSHVIPFMSWHAGAKNPGVASTYDPSRLLSEIQKAKTKADIVIVYVHWGEEMSSKPVSYQKNLARAYIDRGADIVVGSHPHVLQGLEFYKGKTIAYSLGNFIFTNAKKDTVILNTEFADKKLSKVQVIPCEIDNFRPVLIKDAQKAKQLYERLEELSFGVNIDNQGNIAPK